MAGGSFGTKDDEGAEARNKQTGLLLFLTKPESTNQATKSLLSHYIQKAVLEAVNMTSTEQLF